MEDDRSPSIEEVRLIYRDVYNFFVKWSDIKTMGNFSDLISETHELEKRYPYNLCRKMVVETTKIIDKYFLERECTDGE